MKLVPIPKNIYDEYRLKLMFDCYKWDPQFLDHNTIARYALVLTTKEHEELERLTEQLDKETRAAEEFLNKHQELAGPLALPKSVSAEIKQMTNYEPQKHLRLMRYDFHPTTEGKWAVSEVNSDVPGGFAEGTLMPQVAMELLQENNSQSSYWFKSFGQTMLEAIQRKVPPQGRIMLVHCTSYSDDRQVMQFLGDGLKAKGYQVIYAAADHLWFEEGTAYSILDGNEGKVDAIFRFTPLEWLTEIKPKRWQGYFDTTTVSCNHPVAIYAQTKRFPLVWETLEKKGICLATWRELLPETLEVKDAKGREDFIYKPACGRVGEKIAIKEACQEEEYKKILTEVKLHPKKFLAQKKFHSKPLQGEDGEEYHVCLGSYTVDGKHAGYYARISDAPRIDSNAADIPVLICRKGASDQSTESQAPLERNCERTEVGSHLELCKEVYRIWAPTGKRWVDWVRPVPFVAMKECSKGYSISDFTLPPADFVTKGAGDTAVIVDLPGADSVKMGLALAQAGFRPIPIYNGTIEQQEARAIVDNHSVGVALALGAEMLRRIEIPEDAPPAFLTDSGRMQRFKMEISLFDNSWDVYHQDLPTAEYFLEQGVRKIVVVGATFSKDLKKIFYSFQRKGIEFYFTQGYEMPKRVKIQKPFSVKD
ncbi:MAG: glutathionylspermidine synthase family protein [Lachnospiraceae bacterium]|nr:glutathionylspermidine synthase family protein [Lachnospiraceae bacterium]